MRRGADGGSAMTVQDLLAGRLGALPVMRAYRER